MTLLWKVILYASHKPAAKCANIDISFPCLQKPSLVVFSKHPHINSTHFNSVPSSPISANGLRLQLCIYFSSTLFTLHMPLISSVLITHFSALLLLHLLWYTNSPSCTNSHFTLCFFSLLK
jgi:hypothetical protein